MTDIPAQSLRYTLSMIADIAHSGVLANLDDKDAMAVIRQLTRDVWNARGAIEEHRLRVEAIKLLRKMQPLPQHTEDQQNEKSAEVYRQEHENLS